MVFDLLEPADAIPGLAWVSPASAGEGNASLARRCAVPELFAPVGWWSGGVLLAFDVLLDHGQWCAAAGAREVGARPEDRPHADPVDPAVYTARRYRELTPLSELISLDRATFGG